MLAKQPHGCQNILSVDQNLGALGPQRHRVAVGQHGMGGNLPGAVGVDQGTTGEQDALHVAQILAGLEPGTAQSGIGFFHAASVAGDAGADGGAGQGMISMDGELQRLYRAGTITREVALTYAVSPETLAKRL